MRISDWSSDVCSSDLVDAFLAAEDKNFYDHPGVDASSIVRALITNVVRAASGRRPVGRSTITQPVAKNFLLTNAVSHARQLKEALLAFRLAQALSKDRIPDPSLTQTYLDYGH